MKVNVVVVDSGPIIKGAVLNSFSERAIIVPGVIKEIKDVKTRERIRNLPPYFLSIQSPTEQSIKHVKLVASKTGDIKVLSTVDIEVLAMAYELQFTKSEDDINLLFENLDINAGELVEQLNDLQLTLDDEDDESLDEDLVVSDDSEENDEDVEENSENDEDVEENSENEEDVEENSENELEVVELEEEEENVTTTMMPLSTDGGWITNDNFEDMRKTNFGLDKLDDGLAAVEDLEVVPKVGCLTVDYAMQNVLLHMGVTILSMNGMVVKEPRIFVSYCRDCFRKFRRVDIFFCPHCGNSNLGKVPAKISATGEMEVFLKKGFTPNLRNKIFTIPNPKGGKHIDGTHYIYCADQRVPDERPKKSKVIVDIHDDGEIPFVMHDFTTRSSMMGGRSGGQRHNMRPSAPRGNQHNTRRRKR